jgi:ribosomal protein S18 acetylase RimI-like enzyme
VEIRELGLDDVDDAAALLAARHRRQLAAEPLLDPSYAHPAQVLDLVAAAAQADDASGAVALRGGRMVGYLLGAPKPASTWGPNVWVEAAGMALAGGESAETLRDLYALAARRWVAEERVAQYCLVPAHDGALVDAWFRLAFGHQHTHAIQPAPTSTGSPRPPAGVSVRRARRDDIPMLAELDLALPQHQALSPTFSGGEVTTLAEAVAEWEEDFDDEDFTVFVAEHGGAVVGSAIACSVEKSSLHVGVSRPDRAGFLGFAAVKPEARGLGAGRALGETVIGWAAAAGYRSVVTDWRATNLLSSRTWPRLGFRPTFLRLHRVVGY